MTSMGVILLKHLFLVNIYRNKTIWLTTNSNSLFHIQIAETKLNTFPSNSKPLSHNIDISQILYFLTNKKNWKNYGNFQNEHALTQKSFQFFPSKFGFGNCRLNAHVLFSSEICFRRSQSRSSCTRQICANVIAISAEANCD